MGIALVYHQLEEEITCGGESQCVDFLKITLPYGTTCTSCGSLPITCPLKQFYDGDKSVLLEFRSNRVGQFNGFQMVISCVKKSYFNCSGCSIIPDSTSGRTKRHETPTESVVVSCG